MSLPNVNYTVHLSQVKAGLSLAYIREGVGSYPLLLTHGFPETKRIWYRNIGPLADTGFEVIVPDLRGFGDSDLSADGFYDPAAYAKDLYALVHDVLGPPLAPHSWGNYRKTRGHPEPRQHSAAPSPKATLTSIGGCLCRVETEGLPRTVAATNSLPCIGWTTSAPVSIMPHGTNPEVR